MSRLVQPWRTYIRQELGMYQLKSGGLINKLQLRVVTMQPYLYIYLVPFAILLLQIQCTVMNSLMSTSRE